MLKKDDFIEAINYILDEQKAQEKFDKALKEYAPSDFTGFWRDTHLAEWLEKAMDDKYQYISWWLYDTDDQNPRLTRITQGEPGDSDYREWRILTPGDLYDFLSERPIKEETPLDGELQSIVDTVKDYQTNGVRFALNEIQQLIDANAKTKNDGWRSRNALLTYVQNCIHDHYILETGLIPNMDTSEISLVSEKEKENG